MIGAAEEERRLPVFNSERPLCYVGGKPLEGSALNANMILQMV